MRWAPSQRESRQPGVQSRPIPKLIAHASRDEELCPGEVFGSGTVGNGSGAERGVALKRGDVVELTVAGIGVLRNRVV